MHIRIFKGRRGDELMCTHVYALMWTHTHWGERIPCSFITMRPPWIEMTWQLLLMSERFASTITRTHTCTHIQHWTPAAGSPRRPHTHSLTHTRHKLSHNQDYWSLSRTRTPSAVPYGEQRRWLHVGSMGTPVATAVSSGDTPLTLTEIHTEIETDSRKRDWEWDTFLQLQMTSYTLFMQWMESCHTISLIHFSCFLSSGSCY